MKIEKYVSAVPAPIQESIFASGRTHGSRGKGCRIWDANGKEYIDYKTDSAP